MLHITDKSKILQIKNKDGKVYFGKSRELITNKQSTLSHWRKISFKSYITILSPNPSFNKIVDI